MAMKTRRAFLKRILSLFLGVLGGSALVSYFFKNRKGPSAIETRFSRHIFPKKHKKKIIPVIETKYYTRLKDKRVRCGTCFRKCVVKPGDRGFCLSRINVGGSYYIYPDLWEAISPSGGSRRKGAEFSFASRDVHSLHRNCVLHQQMQVLP
jgi:hypothetical protein